MLARLTVSTSHLLDVRIEQATHSSQRTDEENALIVDLDALSALLLPLPNSSWHRAAGACHRALTPLCNNIQNMISSDLDNVAKLLLALESQFDQTLHDSLPVGLLTPPTDDDSAASERRSHPHSSSPTPDHRKRRRHTAATHSASPIVIPPTHPSVPTIVITLSPRQPRAREMEIAAMARVRVPFQDQAFGNLLTVPMYPVFNQVHPPMALSNTNSSASATGTGTETATGTRTRTPAVPNTSSRIDSWKWTNGHWKTVLPSLKEQERRGLFSKPVSVKKRARTGRPVGSTTMSSRAI